MSSYGSAESAVSAAESYEEERRLAEDRPFNQRVVLPNGDEIFNGEGELDGGAEEEEELTRHKVKLASSQIVLAINKKKKKKKGGMLQSF